MPQHEFSPIVRFAASIVLLAASNVHLEASNVLLKYTLHLFDETIVSMKVTNPPSTQMESLASSGATRVKVSDLLFPAIYRRKALSLLLLDPAKRLHVREIARLTGSGPSAMAKELGLLHQAGLLDRYTVGNQAQFSANTRHPVFAELSALLKKTVGLADVLATALAPLTDRIHVAFVFGSVARGDEHAESDVDVAVIGEVDFAEVTKALYPTQEILHREVNAKIFTAAEWQERIAARSTFVGDILAKPKVFIVGTENELEQLGVPGKPGEVQIP